MHALFFAFLYFGISWRPKPQPPLSAELWSELPPVRQQPVKARTEPPAPPPKPAPKVEPPPPKPPAAQAKPPPAPSKADIELKERQRKLEEKKQ